jgi:hypothetical protein
MMAPCHIFAGLDHDILVKDAKCPACGSTIDARSSTSSSQPTSISLTQASSESSAMARPGPSLAVATTLRQQSINYGNISKQRGGQAKVAMPPVLPAVYKFNIRVAHAGYTGADSMASTYTIWTEGWTCAIKHNSPVSYDSLKNTFRNTIQVQTIGFFKKITRPNGHGHWLLASNHLNPEKPAPLLWTHWEGEYSIQDVIQMQGYRLPKGCSTYPGTLIWYPRDVNLDLDRWSISSPNWACGDDTIVPEPGMEEEWLRNLRAEDDTAPEDPSPVPDEPLEEIEEILASTVRAKEKAHKRTISEVVPREEREVERNARVDKDNTPREVRRSGRAPQPRKRH